MVERATRGGAEQGSRSNVAPGSSLTFISSGCTLLDLALGGGWPLGRISNVVGDKSTGKTLIAIEACANFDKQFPKKGRIWYRESESAFDEDYAASLGMPVDRVRFRSKSDPFDTIEDMFEDLEPKIKWCAKYKQPGLYIIDSLDALSDREEMKRKIDKGSYGGNKPKKIGELFRRQVRGIENSQIHVMIISQERSKIGVTFGERSTRSGGRALDYYASQILWLAKLGTIKKTKRGESRAVGIEVRAKAKKNKIGPPFRECDFTIRFNYGVEDLCANLEWLAKVKALDEIRMSKSEAFDIIDKPDRLSDQDYKELSHDVRVAVRRVWREVDNTFLPKRKKY